MFSNSPARPGHTSRMASIFRNAATSLNTSPTRAMRQECSTESDATMVPTQELGEEILADVVYPKLRSIPESPSPREATSNPPFATPCDKMVNHSSPRFLGRYQELAPHSIETIKPQMQYKALGLPRPPHFARADSAVSTNEEEVEVEGEEEDEEEASNSSSTSSASWTGDSQFFRRICPKRQVLAGCEHDCGVSKWLERLPTDFREPPEPEQDELAEPLSPSVELFRGSMRRKQREWERKERAEGFDDADSFV
jgi:hypothetical protein